MALRTISRDKANPRVVLVWSKGVLLDDVKTNGAGADYAKGYDGVTVVPTQIATDTFKAAFGFVPLSGTKGRYVVRKARAPETVEQKLTTAIKAVVAEVLDGE